MSVATDTELRALRKHPFDLLQEMERRGKAALSGTSAAESGTEEEWVGIGFRMAGERFIVARDEVREVMVVPTAVTRSNTFLT